MVPRLILFCGPSGSGKTTIVKRLLADFPELKFSISATTRPQRSNEEDGVDYYFLTEKEFRDKIESDRFLEWEEVYESGFYGTLRSEVDRITLEGKVPIFDVDVEGGLSIKERYGNNLLDIFVIPPSIESLHERLVARQSETEESLQKRIGKAELELTYRDKFSHVIINDRLEPAVNEARSLVSEFINEK